MVLEHHAGEEMDIWPTGNTEVFYYPSLNGAGTDLAGDFVNYVKMFCPDKVFEHAFEWCGGPGFIGFSLLDAGVCARLAVADINPMAVACLGKTLSHNHLSDKVSIFESDNFEAIPDDVKFDLVVGNPPNYFHLNDKHPWGNILADDLRPNDPDWRIHREFYGKVSSHLSPGGLMFIAEVEPFKRQVFIPTKEKEPYDIRERAPIEDFNAMIEDNGLNLLDVGRFVCYDGGANYWMLAVEKT